MYFNRHFSLITGYRYLLKDIIDFIEKINNYGGDNQVLIDIGCGRKPYKKILSNYKYIGIDNYSESQASPDIEGSITKLELDNESVDVALTVWVLDDIIDLDKAISEVSRVLKKGGYYYAVENQSTNLHNEPSDFFRFAPNALINLCQQYNLEIIQYQSYAGDFANIGFSMIIVLRMLFGLFFVESIIRPLYCLPINIVHRSLDKFFRLKMFKGAFERNSLGYCYTFRKKA